MHIEPFRDVAADRLIQADRPRVGDPYATPVVLNICETAAP